MAELFVARAEEIPEGARRLVAHEGREIGVIRAQGALHAFLNVCPHQGGPVCDGSLVHKVEPVLRDDRTYTGMRFDEDTLHLVCPWHGWEFDLRSGRCAGDGAVALRRHPVIEREGAVYVVV